MPIKPLVSIVGTTGVGKSRLAIDLALSLLNHGREHRWHSAKVINSDAMQAYIGADIITNKVPVSERKGVDHLLMAFKQPGEQYVVGQWVNDAIAEIDELHRRNILPIVVGGTAYWMQHLLFPNRLTSLDGESPDILQGPKDAVAASTYSSSLQKAISALPESLLELFLNLPENPPPEQAFLLHSLLSALDPTMAARWHWRDTRKVVRSLEIIKEKGCLASEVMAQQTELVETPRYLSLIFWLYSNPELLQKRLDDRVEQMMRDGLLDDVRFLREIAIQKNLASVASEIDTTSGIFQSIGFREFDPYLSSNIPHQKDYDEGVERTKISNRQYARKQVRWIRNKLIPAINAANETGTKTPFYLMDVRELDKWDEEIRDPAASILHDFLDEKPLPNPITIAKSAASLLDIEKTIKDPISTLITRRKITCPICTTNPERPIMLDEGQEWEAHTKTRRHRRLKRDAERPDWRKVLKEKAARTQIEGLDGDSNRDSGEDIELGFDEKV